MSTVLTVVCILLLLVTSAFATPRHVSITDEPFGAVADDGQDDTAAIQAAITAVGEYGGTVLIPPGAFEASTATGILVENARIRIVFEGDIHVTTDGLESQDCTNLFTVTAERCEFIGAGGMIYGDGEPFTGEKATRNVHRVLILPKLIYFTSSANYGVIRDLVMQDPPGGFAAFIGVDDCRMTGCRLLGGAPHDISEKVQRAVSYYLGVSLISTEGQLITNNHFGFHEGRGMFSWVAGSGTGRHGSTVISNNVFEGGYDHALYISGLVRSVVANNTIRDSVSTAIKLIADDCVVTGNHITNCLYGGISTRNGSRNIIADNIINGFGHRAISVTPYGASNQEPYTDNIIRGNILIGSTDEEKPPTMAGICIWSHQDVSRCRVEGNIIHNTGTTNAGFTSDLPGEPAIFIHGETPGESVSVVGNTVYNALADGIRVENVIHSIVRDNIIDSAGAAVMAPDGSGNVIENNLASRDE